MKVGIVGASGFTGIELLRILLDHPDVEIEMLTSESFVGMKVSELYPSIGINCGLVLEQFDCWEALRRCDLLFLALPHGLSSGVAAEAWKKDKLIIDLGADFRLRDIGVYNSWYKAEHKAPHLLKDAVYGLPEVYGEQIKKSRIIANPGCYPTSAILALYPLLKNNLADARGIIVDSKSAVSGAGRRATAVTHFNSCSDNINPYGVAEHRHTPEIEQELAFAAGQEVRVTFTPQLVPINRGILSTCYVNLAEAADEDDIIKAYTDFYAASPFVQLLPKGVWPHTKWVAGSNNCLLNFKVDRRNNRLIIASVIDNLLKGASGQAVQNMNLMLGLPEAAGLKVSTLYP